jgi:hypothetical protein
MGRPSVIVDGSDRAVQWSYPRLTPFQVKTVLLALAANAASDGSG